MTRQQRIASGIRTATKGWVHSDLPPGQPYIRVNKKNFKLKSGGEKEFYRVEDPYGTPFSEWMADLQKAKQIQQGLEKEYIQGLTEIRGNPLNN